jgi:hypothetical protein
MRGFLRQVFVIATALAFVASGAAWRHCLAAQAALASVASSHGHDSHHTQHGEHHAEHSATHDADLPAADDHTCGKCCSICTVTGVSAPMNSAAVFAASSILYTTETEHCRDRLILVDPGIPKRIA